MLGAALRAARTDHPLLPQPLGLPRFRRVLCLLCCRGRQYGLRPAVPRRIAFRSGAAAHAALSTGGVLAALAVAALSVVGVPGSSPPLGAVQHVCAEL